MRSSVEVIQFILGVEPDGLWGPASQAALDKLTVPAPQTQRVFASSFADPADVHAFRKCKEMGGTNDECFKVGDNGMGCWGDDTSEGSGPSCALPPELMIKRWGTTDNARHKKILVVRNATKQVICILKDRMPHLANLANDATIDLNPDAVHALGWQPPLMEKVSWTWID